VIDESNKSDGDAGKEEMPLATDSFPIAVAIPKFQPQSSGGPVQTLIMVEASQFSGPLPPPALLEHYNTIHPGAADRIIRMAEEQGSHRREMEKLELQANNAVQTRGPVLGFILAMTAVIGGIWLISRGMAVTGLVSLISAIGAPVGVFVYGKYQQRKEKESRSEVSQKSKKKRRRK
jgi:uncharacterized membrane protein